MFQKAQQVEKHQYRDILKNEKTGILDSIYLRRQGKSSSLFCPVIRPSYSY